MFTIGEFSKLAKTTVKTLRYYDEAGLLSPASVDEWTGYRRYTSAQLYPLQRVVALRQAGLQVEEILRILGGADQTDVLNRRRDILVRELEEAEGRVRRLDILLRNMKGGKTMIQPVIRTLPGCTVYFEEAMLKNYAALSEFIPASEARLFATNPHVQFSSPGYCFVSYLDGEYREEDVRVRYSKAVEAPGVEAEGIRFMQLQPVDAVCAMHQGPYETLGEAYALAVNWAQENGYDLAELARERYIDGMWNKEDPADWLTEIELPIRTK